MMCHLSPGGHYLIVGMSSNRCISIGEKMTWEVNTKSTDTSKNEIVKKYKSLQFLKMFCIE